MYKITNMNTRFSCMCTCIQVIINVINPPTTTRDKISRNVDTSQGLSSALKSQTRSNLSTFTGKQIYDLSDCNYACPLTAGPESVHIPKMVLIMFL